MKTTRHITVSTAMLVMAMVLLVLLPGEASSRLLGEMDLSYTDFKSSETGSNFAAKSFSQRYSVNYDKSGLFLGGRLGSYDLAIGYEWLSFKTETETATGLNRTSEDTSKAKGHINYQGRLVFNPKEMPLKLTAYSYDLHRTRFTSDSGTNGSSYSASNSGYTRISPGLTRDIENGIHVVSGMTLIAGVKNGMTNGYNEVLRHFPMLMLDYRDEINKDRARLEPVDNRLSRLAFVSLNKKNNWFHYRYVTYDDKINDGNNYSESQIQLGTVDHNLKRLWIDFSNWLSVSADGQYTVHNKIKTGDNYQEFALNLFGHAKRSTWEARTFNTFTRLYEVDKNTITYQTSVPVYASGLISPSANWSAFGKYKNNHTENNEYFSTVNSGYRLEAYRNSPFTVSHGLSVEKIMASEGVAGLVMSGSVATQSTMAFSRNLAMNGSYNITNYRTSNGDNTINTFNHDLSGGVRYRVTDTFQVAGVQNFKYLSGAAQPIGSSITGSVAESANQVAPRQEAKQNSGSSYNSVTKVMVRWLPAPRFFVDVSLTEDIFESSSGLRSDITTGDVRLEYKNGTLNVSSKNRYVKGDVDNIDTSSYFKSENALNVALNRNVDAAASVIYSQDLDTKGAKATLNWEQSLRWKILGSGIQRTMVEINESFVSKESHVGDSVNKKITNRQNTAGLGVKYFPLRNLLLAGGARFSFLNSDTANGSLSYYSSMSIQFRLVSAGIDYTYGKNSVANLVEKRLTANMRKVF